MKKTVSLLAAATVMLSALSGCSLFHEHEWDLTGEKPVCKECEETRDGTTDELVENKWHGDLEDGEYRAYLTNTEDTVNFKFKMPEKSFTLEWVRENCEQMYQASGYLKSDVKDALDKGYEVFILDEEEIDIINDEYKVYKKYCGDNLKKAEFEIYVGDELVQVYTNGEETYNFFKDELGEFGYHHS